jgi:hypothetical protein
MNLQGCKDLLIQFLLFWEFIFTGFAVAISFEISALISVVVKYFLDVLNHDICSECDGGKIVFVAVMTL